MLQFSSSSLDHSGWTLRQGNKKSRKTFPEYSLLVWHSGSTKSLMRWRQRVFGTEWTLTEVSGTNDLLLAWVPGHSGLIGNEKVDMLDKKEANMDSLGHEPYCCLASCHKRGYRILIGFLTWHCRLRRDMHRILVKREEVLLRYCQEEEEAEIYSFL